MCLSLCNKCPYATQQDNKIKIINENKETLILMLAPGEEEFKNKRPLCSSNPTSATQRIKKALKELGKSLDDFAITELIKCYPGKGANRNNEPNILAYYPCSLLLIKELKKGNYRKVIAFGVQPIQVINTIKQQYKFNFEIVECRHPNGKGATNKVIKEAFKKVI